MAKGASEAGLRPAIAVIGDSTFLHSGVTGLMDAVAADTDMTLIILDNETVAMTGGQPTILASSRLEKLILALGVETEQFHLLSAHPKRGAMNTEVIRSAITHEGLSVIVMVRECVETAKRQRRAATQRNRTTGPTAGVGT
jgi:indolepyruvate ferredoxin oxidoreductase alpha subunit